MQKPLDIKSAKPTSSPLGALNDVKVIDLTRVLGGPYATMILADHGASVVKIEPPQGDETRAWGPPFLEREQDASYYLGVNRNKRSLAIDLSHADGQSALMRLLEGADVLVENFKPGTMDKWGLGYDANLSVRFPKLIHCRISGFGADGPLGGLPGYDAAVQAMTGLMSINGTSELGATRLGAPIVDLSTGLYSAIAILMALHERSISQRGQFIDMSLYDCGLAMLHPYAANYLLGGRRPVPLGNRHPNLAPCDKFILRDGEIFIAVGNDGQFAKLTKALGCPELSIDPRFQTNSDRLQNRDELSRLLGTAMAHYNRDELAQRLLRIGVPAGAVLHVDESLSSAHTQHRGMVIDTPAFRGVATPIKFSRSRHEGLRPPPRFAEHNADVLDEAGFSRTEIERLRSKGVLAEKLRVATPTPSRAPEFAARRFVKEDGA